MKRIIVRSLLVIAVATMLVAPAGSAHAAGAGVCTVVGNVDLGDPLNANGRDSTYLFTDTTLECFGSADISGTWNTSASGNTTGIIAGGETCEHGKSNGAGGLSATSAGRSISGPVTFNRVGSVVQAGGNFNHSNGKNYLWTGQFQFTPNPVTDAAKCTSQDPLVGVERATLVGVAEIVTAE